MKPLTVISLNFNSFEYFQCRITSNIFTQKLSINFTAEIVEKFISKSSEKAEVWTSFQTSAELSSVYFTNLVPRTNYLR